MALAGAEKQVDVIGHDNPWAKIITFTVKMAEASFDDSTKFGAAEVTLAGAGIEPHFQAFAEAFVIFFPLGFIPRFGMQFHPSIAFVLPRGEFFLR